MKRATNSTNNGILWLKLDQDSKQLLEESYPPRYPRIFYDHVTLAFGVTRGSVSHLIGQAATVQAYAHAHNAQIEAVRIEPNELPDTYGVPHITLSALEGTAPFQSVAMLKAEHEESAIDPPLTLNGFLEFMPLS
jgi:hypothetical protein